MIVLLRDETERALDEGYSALRVTGEMTWALKGLPGCGRLMEYEAKLNDFFPGSKCLAICQYAKRRFTPALARYEFKAQRKDGTEFDAELSVSRIAYQAGIARQGIVRDITERKTEAMKILKGDAETKNIPIN